MFAVDTNIFLYACNPSSPEYARARELIEGWRLDSLPWYISWGVAYEFLRVATHPSIFPNPLSGKQALAFLDAIFASSSLRILNHTSAHWSLLKADYATHHWLQGNLIHDFHTLVLMREQGIKTIYTRDNDFRQFEGIEVIDPFR